MKNQVIALSIVFTLFFLVSCTKDGGSSSSTNTQTPLIKTIAQKVVYGTTYNSYTKQNLYYDSKNRITSRVDSADTGNKFLYTYASDKHFTMDIYNANALSIHFELFLNNNNEQDSSYQYNDTQDTTWEKFTYTYNSNNKIVTAKDVQKSRDKMGGQRTDITTTNYTYDALGNITSTTDNYGIVNNYTYYANLTYGAPLYTSPINFFYGNYVKTLSTNKTGKLTNFTYTYTFDSAKRLSTARQVSDDGKISVTTVYTYY